MSMFRLPAFLLAIAAASLLVTAAVALAAPGGPIVSTRLAGSPSTGSPGTGSPGAGSVGAGSVGAGSVGRSSAVSAPATGRWGSGLSGTPSVPASAYRATRRSPVTIVGMFGDASVAAQREQWQFTHSSFRGDLDLAVGGPIEHSWAQVARGADVRQWKALAATLRGSWHYRTVYLRYAHEANGTWMPWSVAPAQVADFRTSFRLFRTTMLRELRGHDVKFVFAPNFGSWRYPPEAIWPGNDVVDVVGLSTYEWDDYATAAQWQSFVRSSIGPDCWAAFAKRHGKPIAFSEWGGRSPYFLRAMRAWMATHAGTGPGRLIYEVYLNADDFALDTRTAATYHSLSWGR